MLQGLEEMGSDEDEETKRWEEEQIEKGVKASAPDQAPSQPTTAHLSSLEQAFLIGATTVGFTDGQSAYMTPSYAPAVQAYAGIPEQSASVTSSQNTFQIPDKLVPITVESLKSRLSNRLRDLQDSASGHRQRLEQIEDDLERSRDEVGRVEGCRGDVGRGYEFYQEMRGYLRDFLSCLGEKVLQHSLTAVCGMVTV